MMQMMFCGRTNTMKDVADTLTYYLENTVVEVKESAQGIKIILQDDTAVKLFFKDEVKTAEEMQAEIGRMYNFYASIETDKKDLQEGLLRQIAVWNSVYIIEFEINEVDERNNFIYSAIINTISHHKAYYILGNFEIRDGLNKLVFNAEGESELDELTPIARPDSLYPNRGEVSESDEVRWEKTANKMKELNLPTMSKMQLQLRESEVQPRTTEEIVKRAISLVTVALYSEALYSDKNHDTKKAMEYVETINNKLGVVNFLSENEANYINDEVYNDKNCFMFNWQYESSAFLFWSVGLLPNINNVDKICDVTEVVRVIRDAESLEDMINKASLKPISELLEEQDMIMRYRWAHIELASNRQPIPDLYDIGVLEKRNQSLNWLLTKLYGDDWDEIDTPA